MTPERTAVELHSSVVDGVRYLVNEFAERPDWQETIWRASRAHPYKGEKRELFDRTHQSKPVRVKVGEGWEAEKIFQFLLKNGQFSAPMWPVIHGSPPVYTGKIDLLAPNHDPIVRLVENAKLRIINVTLPTHIFFPGYIVVEVVKRDGSAYLEVWGKGRGNLAYANEVGGPMLFKAIISLVPSAYAASRGR